MNKPPLPVTLLGAAGLLPFLGGALASHSLLPGVDNPFTGLLILQSYGSAILAFMGGCLWGFAAQAGRTGFREFAVSVIPGLWAFSVTFSPSAMGSLMLGFVLLLVFDLMFRGWGLGPRWWLTLRIPLSVGAIACLAVGALA